MTFTRSDEPSERSPLCPDGHLEDDALFPPGATWALRRALAELADRPWPVLYLGSADWGRAFPRAEGCHRLDAVTGITTTHAPACTRSTPAVDRGLMLLMRPVTRSAIEIS